MLLAGFQIFKLAVTFIIFIKTFEIVVFFIIVTALAVHMTGSKAAHESLDVFLVFPLLFQLLVVELGDVAVLGIGSVVGCSLAEEAVIFVAFFIDVFLLFIASPFLDDLFWR